MYILIKIILQNLSELTQGSTSNGIHWSLYIETVHSWNYEISRAAKCRGDGSMQNVHVFRCILDIFNHLCERSSLNSQKQCNSDSVYCSGKFRVGDKGTTQPHGDCEDVPSARAVLRAASGRRSSKTWVLLSADGLSSPIVLSLVDRVSAIMSPPGL